MNRIGIIGAMQIEIDLLLEKLHIHEEYTIAKMPFYKGFLRIKRLLLLAVGLGKSMQLRVHKF